MRKLTKAERATHTIGYCPFGGDGKGSGKGKRQYPTKAAAKRAMKSANRTEARQPGSHPLVTVYLCRCGCWHTTKQVTRS